MKTIQVVAAIIKRVDETGNTLFLATQRGYGEFKDKWEFPGGKIEEGETAKEALKREILEELDMKISVGDRIKTVEYDYPTFHLSMDCFMCKTPILKEHEAARWLDKSSLSSVDWLPADIEIVQILEE